MEALEQGWYIVTVSCYSRDQLDREKRNQQLRQRNMVCELARTFFIKAVNNKHTICNVVLPNADLMLERKPLAECKELGGCGKKEEGGR